MKYFTYIILCSNGKYYTGHCKDTQLRFDRHLSRSGAKFTAQNRPITILWSEEFDNKTEAVKRERQIKGWRRDKKENLINRKWK